MRFNTVQKYLKILVFSTPLALRTFLTSLPKFLAIDLSDEMADACLKHVLNLNMSSLVDNSIYLWTCNVLVAAPVWLL
jgi:hypothetical protein